MSGSMGYGMEVMMQKMIIAKMFKPYLKDAATANDGSLTAKDLKRCESYALLTATTLGANYAILHGQSMTMEQRAAQTLLGGLTPLYDDLFDRPELDTERLLYLKQHPHKAVPTSTREHLFLRFLRVLQHLAADIDVFNAQFMDVYRTQLASKDQERAGIEGEALKTILYEKGGHAALLFRSLMPYPMRDGEKEAIMQWGWVIQLLDDTFDLYEDHQDGIRTLANTAHSMDAYVAMCEAEFRELATRFRAADFPKRATERALNRMLFIICWGLVALDKLKALPEHGGRFDPAAYDRKQLICDMDKFANQVRGVGAYLKFRW